jgi:hypothetical protein
MREPTDAGPSGYIHRDTREHRGKLRSSLRLWLAFDDHPAWCAAHALPLEP